MPPFECAMEGRRLRIAEQKAVVAGDAAAVVRLFEDDAMLMPPNQQSLRGRLPIQRFHEGWVHSPMKPASFAFDHLEATVCGESAYDVGTYKMSMPAGASGSIHDTGTYAVVLKHTSGGWKIGYLIFNSDLPSRPQPAPTN